MIFYRAQKTHSFGDVRDLKLGMDLFRVKLHQLEFAFWPFYGQRTAKSVPMLEIREETIPN